MFYTTCIPYVIYLPWKNSIKKNDQLLKQSFKYRASERTCDVFNGRVEWAVDSRGVKGDHHQAVRFFLQKVKHGGGLKTKAPRVVFGTYDELQHLVVHILIGVAERVRIRMREDDGCPWYLENVHLCLQGRVRQVDDHS